MKLNNKFLVVLLCVLLLFNICFIGFSSAKTYDLTDYKNCIKENCNWCIVHNLENDNFYFITTTNTGRYIYTKAATYNGVSCSSGYFEVTGGKIFGIYDFDINTNKFTNYRETSMYGHVELGYSEVIACSYNVFYCDSSNVFFPKTPLPSKVYINPTIMEIAEMNLEEKLVGQTLGIQLTTLIKVGLTIFGLLLAPFLIKFRNWQIQ